MKILHITFYYTSGLGYQENIFPLYQKKLGNEVLIVTSNRLSLYTPVKKDNPVDIGRFDYEVPTIRLKGNRRLKGKCLVMSNLMRTLEQEKPDYIFHHGLTLPSLITAVKYKKKYPSVFLVADNHADLNNSARNILWRLIYYKLQWKFKLKKCLKYLDLVFGVTPARCYFAENILGIPHKKIRLLPIGADEDRYDEISSNKKENKRLKVVIGGKWYRGKGLEELIDAVRGLDLDLEIFGRLDDDFIKSKVEKASENVSFVGWKDRKGTFTLLNNADIAIWPKYHTTLVEDAIAARLPLILRYHGSTSHFINGNGAFLFTGETNEIRQLLELLSSSKEIVENMKQNTDKQLDLLSYNRIAKESIEYYYDQEPKYIHQKIMNSALCDPNNRGFHKLEERRIQKRE